MLVSGTFVSSPQLGELCINEKYLLSVDDCGVIDHFDSISSVSSMRLLESGETVTKIPPGSFVLPSFVDLHLHAPQFLYQGTGLDLPLLEWLAKYTFVSEERIDSDPALAKEVYTALANRLIRNGTGVVMLFGTIKKETNLSLAEIMYEYGIRAFVGKVSMDQSSRPSYKEDSAESSLDAAMSFVQECRSRFESLIEPVLTPRFVPTCSDDLLSGLGALSEKHSLKVQSHLAEARDQVEWVKSERGMDDLDIFEKNSLLTPRTIQAHCTFLGPPSLSFLHYRGSSIAHCPLSNAYFSSQPFRLREALDLGVTVGLGTDIAGGYSCDIMSAMRQCVSTSRMRQNAVTWIESLYLATRGGAQALDLNIGCFEVGSVFDAQWIQLNVDDGPIDWFGETTESITMEMVEKWWCLGDDRNRKALWVQGRRL